MRANEYKRGVNGEKLFDELWDFIESDEGKAKLKELDNHWSEVMELAERYGFITQAAGGTAVLSTHDAMIEQMGADEEAKRLRMCNVELGDDHE